jgi:hypothetical protein
MLLLKYLILAVLLLFSGVCTASDTVSPGFLQGHLRIISPRPVEPTDQDFPAVNGESFAEYPLVVLSQDGKQEIARFAADAQGDYRVSLPPGIYVLDVQDRIRKHVRATPRSFTVVSNQTVHVNMEIDTGVR